MGYKFDDRQIKCPIFCNVIRTKGGQFIGIECLHIETNLGFEVSHTLRLENSGELHDYLAIFCKDLYETCPYYQAYCKMGGY